jgi:hypothetical protein
MSDISDHPCDVDVVRSDATSNHNSMHGQEMCDISDPLLSCDADVVGSGATSNHNSMLDQEMSDISDPLLSCDADVDVSLALVPHLTTILCLIRSHPTFPNTICFHLMLMLPGLVPH